VAVPLRPLDPADRIGIRSRMRRATNDPAEVVSNDVMVANAIALAMDAVKEFDEFDWLDLEAGLFADLADHSFAELLANLDETARNGPATAGGLCPTLNEQDAAFMHDDGADAYERSGWEFALQHALTIVRRAIPRLIE
jgi:hypothetical protein